MDFLEKKLTDNQIDKLPPFERLCWFNLCYDYDITEIPKLTICFFQSNPEVFYEYLESFKLLFNDKIKLPFKIDKTILLLLLDILKDYELEGKIRNSAKFIRGQFNYKYKYWFNLLAEKNKTICVSCGTDKNISIDHVIPLSKGGLNEIENMQFLCKNCNSKKGAKI